MTKLLKHWIPEEMLLMSESLGLPPDILLSDSDLSDIPDDTGSIDDNPSLPHRIPLIKPPRDLIVDSSTEFLRLITAANGASLVKSRIEPAKPSLVRPARVSPNFSSRLWILNRAYSFVRLMPTLSDWSKSSLHTIRSACLSLLYF